MHAISATEALTLWLYQIVTAGIDDRRGIQCRSVTLQTNRGVDRRFAQIYSTKPSRSSYLELCHKDKV
jgi:hypothetical protein